MSADTFYFPGGYAAPGFQELLVVTNPGDTAAAVSFVYYLSDGLPIVAPNPHCAEVLAYGRCTEDVTVDVGLRGEVAARVRSESIPPTRPATIAVERLLFFKTDQGFGTVSGGWGTDGVNRLTNRQYFAEGETDTGSKELISILNPNGIDVDVTFNYSLHLMSPIDFG